MHLWVVAIRKSLLSQSAMPALELNMFLKKRKYYANMFSLKYIQERSKFPVIYLWFHFLLCFVFYSTIHLARVFAWIVCFCSLRITTLLKSTWETKSIYCFGAGVPRTWLKTICCYILSREKEGIQMLFIFVFLFFNWCLKSLALSTYRNHSKNLFSNLNQCS